MRLRRSQRASMTTPRPQWRTSATKMLKTRRAQKPALIAKRLRASTASAMATPTQAASVSIIIIGAGIATYPKRLPRRRHMAAILRTSKAMPKPNRQTAAPKPQLRTAALLIQAQTAKRSRHQPKHRPSPPRSLPSPDTLQNHTTGTLRPITIMLDRRCLPSSTL